MKRTAILVVICVVAVASSISGVERMPAPQEPHNAEWFYVTGFVMKPGAYALQPEMTVQMGIAIAGGLTERGSNRGIRIARMVDGQRVDIDVELSTIVQANDTILVRQRLQ